MASVQGGPGVIRDQWDFVVFRTIDEVGLIDHPYIRYLPNDRWTSVIREEKEG